VRRGIVVECEVNEVVVDWIACCETGGSNQRLPVIARLLGVGREAAIGRCCFGEI
jgi:hypothetical protein